MSKMAVTSVLVIFSYFPRQASQNSAVNGNREVPIHRLKRMTMNIKQSFIEVSGKIYSELSGVWVILTEAPSQV
jgi:hypothetical protein